MGLKASTSKSAINFIEYYAGISLNRRALQVWLKRRKISMGRLAKMLKISSKKFRWKLYKHKNSTGERSLHLSILWVRGKQSECYGSRQ